MSGPIFLLLHILLFGVWLIPTSTLAGGGAGLWKIPSDQERGSLSIMADLFVTTSPDGKSLEATISGQCEPPSLSPKETRNFELNITQLSYYTVKDFSDASDMEATQELDGFFLTLPSVPPGLQVCLEESDASAKFGVYLDHLVKKDENSLIAKVVLYKLMPVQ